MHVYYICYELSSTTMIEIRRNIRFPFVGFNTSIMNYTYANDIYSFPNLFTIMNAPLSLISSTWHFPVFPPTVFLPFLSFLPWSVFLCNSCSSRFVEPGYSSKPRLSQQRLSLLSRRLTRLPSDHRVDRVPSSFCSFHVAYRSLLWRSL